MELNMPVCRACYKCHASCLWSGRFQKGRHSSYSFQEGLFGSQVGFHSTQPRLPPDLKGAPHSMWTPSSVPHLPVVNPWLALGDQEESPHRTCMQVEGCLDKEFWNPGSPEGRGQDGSPTVLMTVWATDWIPMCFIGNHVGALHGNRPLPGKESHGLRGSPEFFPLSASPESRSNQKTGSPSPLLTPQSRLHGTGRGFISIQYLQQLRWGLLFVPT